MSIEIFLKLIVLMEKYDDIEFFYKVYHHTKDLCKEKRELLKLKTYNFILPNQAFSCMTKKVITLEFVVSSLNSLPYHA